ncbi:MAG: aspartate kinase [Bacteroidetes bacterium CG2_30_33_31]|nr:MAG: aspartate kinase [Bacteroidetes bacterium CG2_30_33_31]
MIVRKFGGTSVGSPDRMKQVAEIINDGQKQMVVLSAISGITNKLVNISNMLYNKEYEIARSEIARMELFYLDFANTLLANIEIRDEAYKVIEIRKNYLLSFIEKMYNILQEKALLSDGEIVSTAFFDLYLQEKNLKSKQISALSFMRIDKNLEPDEFYILENLKREIQNYPQDKIFITQGYICRNAFGEIDNLKRGGSDYSATLIGAAIKSERVEIWTDIDGIHNNDPRFVKDTKSINNLSFEEAAELAYFGAKILHPAALLPAKKNDIKVLLKNTLEIKAKGTLISNIHNIEGIKAVAAKDGITMIRIHSGRMLNAYGFLRKVFEVFEIYKTPIDMISTSEVSIAVTIDDNKFLKEIVKDLRRFCEVDIEKGQTIIAIVGLMRKNKKGYAAKVFDSLNNIAVKMISYGASDHNISLLIDGKKKIEALQVLQSSILSKNNL